MKKPRRAKQPTIRLIRNANVLLTVAQARDERTKIGVHSGALLDLDEPDWNGVVLDDIAYALANIRRWNGHMARQVSVLEHSLWVARACVPQRRLGALLHDAHEYAVGDLTRPLVATLDCRLPGARREIQAMRREWDVAVARRVLSFGEALDAPPAAAEMLADQMRSPEVSAADDAILRIEWAECRAATASALMSQHIIPSPSFLIELWTHEVATEAQSWVLAWHANAPSRQA